MYVSIQSEEGKAIHPSSRGRQEELPLDYGEVSLFVLFRPSDDWMRATTLGWSASRSLMRFRYYSHLKTHPLTHPAQCVTKYLGTLWSSRDMKFTTT